jgi:ABC-2 type transport system permease protein
MLANVFTKTIRDRWMGAAIAGGAIALWLLMAASIYRDIDLTIYTDMPEFMRNLMGIPEGADVGALAYSVVLGFAGAVTVASIALSMGSASIAGEEKNGTFGLLLGNPKTRTSVLASKAGSMVLLVGMATLILWGAGIVVPEILDFETGGMFLGAIIFHLFVNAILYGFMAMMIGAWTGDRTKASGITAGVIVLSFFAVGVLPLIEGASDLAKIFPWYYFDSSDPVMNGVHWGHIGILLGLSAAFATAAVIGLNRRDVREHTTGVTLLDRLRENPKTKKIIERLAGSARVSRIWAKTLSEYQGLLIITGYTMFLMMGVLLGPLYTFMDEALVTFTESAPEILVAMTGNADLATPEGWYQTETFSMMGPIAVILVTAAIGAKGLAGEEEKRTMGLLLANPIKRSTVVLEKTVAMIYAAAVVGFLTFAGVALGSLHLAATSALMTLLGLAFGALALALGAATGRVRIAIYGTIGAGLAFYLLNSMLPLSDDLAGYAKWTPFYYFLGSDPLANGMNWIHAGVLAGITVALVALAVVLFDRRDIKQAG